MAKMRVAGAKQVLRALQEGKAACLYLAVDAENSIKETLLAAADGVPVVLVPGKKELGKMFGLSVAAAAGADLV